LSLSAAGRSRAEGMISLRVMLRRYTHPAELKSQNHAVTAPPLLSLRSSYPLRVFDHSMTP